MQVKTRSRIILNCVHGSLFTVHRSRLAGSPTCSDETYGTHGAYVLGPIGDKRRTANRERGTVNPLVPGAQQHPELWSVQEEAD